MTDRELLVLAAKAAGVHEGFINEYGGGKTFCWNPLKDDGDSMRLAVLLSLRVEPYTGVKMGEHQTAVANITDVYSLHSSSIRLSEPHNLDSGAATRRAIVRVAAEIGKSLP
ncbi:hypothetical protein [Pseudomonas synxantha]|uniref:Phage protein n=1 Tax=Pseudomonas synxantha TaxID=47883 RepID=A0AAU8TMF6_9PSED|nr:hypothetical protein [Pseudomonas synxantha]AKA81761.1 hypothetical protein VO64_1215 [Pseudomonas synxantha]